MRIRLKLVVAVVVLEQMMFHDRYIVECHLIKRMVYTVDSVVSLCSPCTACITWRVKGLMLNAHGVCRGFVVLLVKISWKRDACFNNVAIIKTTGVMY